MKKLLFLVIIIFLAVIFILGCSCQDETNNKHIWEFVGTKSVTYFPKGYYTDYRSTDTTILLLSKDGINEYYNNYCIYEAVKLSNGTMTIKKSATYKLIK